ncbi:hypothetical protein ABK040_008685 [Willaertia magna]
MSRLIIACLVLSMAVLCTAIYQPLSDGEMKQLFIKFSRKHGRLYGTEEHSKRFNIFKANVEKARYYNAIAGDRENYGITKFMDLTPEEFKRMYLMKTYTPEQARSILATKNKVSVSDDMVKAMPTAWDWREHGAVTEVKNQGSCGSCWTFSTTGNVEGQWFLKKNQKVVLSEQQLVDCDHNCVTYENQQACDAGCNGGLMWSAYQYVIKAGGLVGEKDYPYEAVDDTCRFNSSKVIAKISSWTQLPTDEDQLAAWLAQNGPVAIAINAEWLQFYMGGISNPWWCSPQDLDHGVLLVGYGEGKNLFGSVEKYWIVKNSWGADWGESGYFRIIRGKGKCGLNTVPTSSIV